MDNPLITSGRHTGQEGSIVVSLAGALILLLVLLGSIQMGYAFYVKRDMQKAADLAALSGVQMLGDGTECGVATLHAEAVVALNFPGLDTPAVVTCEQWSDGVTTAPDSGFNAVRVSLSKDLLPLVPYTGTWSVKNVEAMAAINNPQAVFSVGSRLLRSTLLGLLNLDVLDAKGTVTADALLKELGLLGGGLDLGVGTPEELVALPAVKLADLLNASVSVLSQSETANAEVSAVQNVVNALLNVSNIDSIMVKLFGQEGADGVSDGALFILAETANASSALAAKVNALDLIATSAFLSNSENFLKLEPTEIDLGLVNLKANAYVVAPPSFGIGGIGTTAKNAQVNLDLSIGLLPLPLVEWASTDPSLRLVVELAQSHAELTDAVCRNSEGQPEASFEVRNDLAGLCIAPPGAPDHFQCSAEQELESGPLVTLLKGVLGEGIKVNVPYGGSLLGNLVTSGAQSYTVSNPPEETASVTVGDTQIDLSELGNILTAVILGAAGQQGLTGSEQKQLAENRWSENGGRWNGGLENSALKTKQEVEALQTWLNNNGGVLGILSGGLVGLVGGVLGAVGGLLGVVTGLVGAILDGLLGWLLCGEGCQVGKIKDAMFGSDGNSAVAGLLAIVFNLLGPVLSSLSNVLNGLMDTLGLSLAETDLTLYSVQCGGPRLVE